MQQHPGEEGVSEMVGAMLLLGLTVIGVVLVGIVFLSGPQPDAIPRASIAAGMNETDRLVLVHEGGDPLRAGEYRIYVDTGSGLVIGTDSFTEPEDGAWSVGGSLVYNGPGTPERVVVTAISGGSETVLAEPEFRGGTERFSPDPAGPGMTPGTPESEGGGNTSPIQIVFPGNSPDLTFISNSATMKANVTDPGITRMDFVMYDYNVPPQVSDIHYNVHWDPVDEQYHSDFSFPHGHIKDVQSVVVMAIAFNDTAVVGCDARKVNIKVS